MSMVPNDPDPRPDDLEVVFVDLDRCLLVDDSVGMLLTRLVQRGLVRRRVLVQGMWLYLRYRLNLLHPDELLDQRVEELRGVAEREIAAEAEALFEEVVRFRYRSTMLHELDRHRVAGRPIYLLTGGLPYLPRRVAADLELAGAVTTEAEVVDGRFTGRLLDPPCVAAGKVVHAQRLMSRLGGRLDRAWFYTDSFTDHALLRIVEHPRAVNPDRKLARLARRRRWPIIT